MYYLDTSILVAYYYPEPGSDAVEEFLLKLKRPIISSLTEVELVSALARKIREKDLSITDGNKIFTEFQSHLKQSYFKRIAIEDSHYHTAIHWIAQFATPLRTLDALHLAVVAESGLTMITADKQLKSSAKYFGLEALDILEVTS